MKQKILLLGADGQISFDIRQVLPDESIELILSTRNEFVAGEDDLTAYLDSVGQLDFIINTIAFHKTDQCEDKSDLAFKMNGIFVLELARYCNANNITLIHFSTDYVFDGTKQSAYTESDHPNPLNVYGMSKLAGEIFVTNYCPKYFILRVSSVFGTKPSDNPNINFVEKMLSFARENKSWQVINNQYMAPTFARDVAKIIKTMILEKIETYGIYHCCNKGTTSWYDFALTIFDRCGIKADIQPVAYDSYHTKARRPQFSTMATGKIEKITHIRPWQDALEEYLEVKGYSS